MQNFPDLINLLIEAVGVNLVVQHLASYCTYKAAQTEEPDHTHWLQDADLLDEISWELKGDMRSDPE